MFLINLNKITKEVFEFHNFYKFQANLLTFIFMQEIVNFSGVIGAILEFDKIMIKMKKLKSD